MRLFHAASVAALGMLTASACASNRDPRGVTWVATPSAPTVTVRNDNWLDVALYVLRGGARVRLGTVRSTATESFRLPPEASDLPVQVIADPIGSTAIYQTDPVVLGPGQRLELRVADAISTSTFSVRNRQ